MTIYCKNCPELAETLLILMTCRKYKTDLRMAPMSSSNNTTEYPIKCLECIQNQKENRIIDEKIK